MYYNNVEEIDVANMGGGPSAMYAADALLACEQFLEVHGQNAVG